MNPFFNNDFLTGNNEFFKSWQQFQLPQIDAAAWLNLTRKNIETISVASQIANESAQATARRSAEFFRENVENALNAGRDILTNNTPDQNTARQAEFAKQAIKTGFEQLRELAEMATKSQFEAFDLLSTRLRENIDEAQNIATAKNAKNDNSRKKAA